jgi:uncharacterized repeat protein (TIGR03803 family)
MNNIIRGAWAWAKSVFFADSIGFVSIWFLILATTASLLRADRAADLRNERTPPGAVMTPPWKKFTGFVPASGGPTGYTPAQMRRAYGVDQLNTTGQGQVIAIVDAYGSPTIQADLDTFCQAMGIPSTTVQVYYPQGVPALNSNWAMETSLDVEWAHAIAPGATIVLIATQSNGNSDLFAGVDFAASTGATQVSLSWGEPEYSDETTSDFHFNVPGVTFFASSGDGGAGVIYPACSPLVVSVGGTTVDLDSSGNIISETAWSGSGGGSSVYETVPSYQSGWWSGPGRGVPDVAYDADPNTGVPIFMTGAGWVQIGGTSIGAPQWAALCAVANSLRLQSINSAPGVFYSLATANYTAYFHDIVSGSNGAYSASPGYDLVTGLGTPLANQIIPVLAGDSSTQAAAPVFSPPPGAYANTQNVTVSILCATPGATIRYTTDGSTPTETYGTPYSVPVPINAATTLTAIAYKSGLTDSPVTTGNYTFLPQVAAPTFSPPAGKYRGAQTVTISTTTNGALIRYTTDGSLPSETKGMLYSGPVNITTSTELNAIAYKTGFIDSPVTNGFYAISLLKVLYNFTGSVSGPSGLTLGSDGNFYGTTGSGGSSNGGIVFKMTPAGVVTTLASFDVVNGQIPLPNGVMQAGDGNFYGTTDSAGSSGIDGTAFKMTPAGVLTTLGSFAGANGANPHAGLIQASDGNFYGTTVNGGSYNFGNVFKMTPAGGLTSLVSFDGTTNGETPAGALIQGSDGNFYGTTANVDGGPTGTVFKMTPAGVLTTLVLFNGDNGAQPAAALVQGTDGNFYGTTEGVTNGDGPNVGTVFKMTPAGVLTTLVSFNETNGAVPAAPLIQASDGNFYGTAAWGGAFDIGIVFRVTPAGVYTILASFDGSDGDHPTTSLVQGRDGNFYGTANDGPSGNGVIYQLLQAAAPVFSPAAGTYPGAQTVTITSATSGATIVYTTDGSLPTETNGTIYTGPVNIGTATTLRAMAYESGSIDSGITSGAYTISVAVSPGNGFYNTPVSPSQSGVFTATFDASPSLSPINAVIALSKGTQTAYSGLSCVARFNASGDIDAYNGSAANYQAASVIPYAKNTTYHFRMVVNVPANTYSVYVTPPGGSELTVGLNYKFRMAATSLDTWTIDVNATPGGSVTVSNRLIIGNQSAATPTFSPPAGTYTSAQAVLINDSTSGATIRYTTDGSTPSETNGTIYSGSFSIGATTTLKALAYKTGYTDSAVVTGLYTISLPQAAAPTLSPPAGTYASAQTVTIASVTSGASIRYTTDGSTPSETAGTICSGPVSIGSTTTLKAIAYKSGMADSSVTSGPYTINIVTRSLTGSSGDGFHALALTSTQAGTFTATFDATPSVSPENGVVGLSKGTATAYTGLSCIARFNPTGQIDAYNGTGYGASTINYSARVTYHFRLVVNVPAHTYSVYVTPAGGSEQTVGLNYAFRATQTSLDTWILDLNSTPSGCSLTANNLNP